MITQKARTEIGIPALAGLIIGLFVLLLLVPTQVARAVSCTNLGTGFGTKVDATNHFGTVGAATRVSVSSSCPIVRSVYIWLDTDNEAEIGWYQDGSSGNVDKCDVTTTPHVLVWARTAGFNKCKSGTVAVTGAAGYYLQNPAHDQTIEYYYQGSYQGFFSVAFTQGQSWAYSERHVVGDNLVVDWSSLAYLGNSGTWNNWPTIQEWTYGDTSGYKYCPYSATHWAVKKSTATC